MTFSIYDAAIPGLLQTMTAVSKIIDKAAAHCEARKIDPNALLQARLFPDMFAFPRQIQVMTDAAKGLAARLANVDVPKYEDNEATFADLKERLKKTADFVSSLKPAQFEGAESRSVTIPLRSGPLTFTGQDYMTKFALPNFYFHATTAYALLRHNGVEIGKMDFLNAK